ncbi:MAG: hypothetical protein WC546_06580 [Candidatus Omnitrophota bacterium]
MDKLKKGIDSKKIKIILGCFLLAAASICLAQEIDIGLRVREDGENVAIAAKTEATSNSPIRIRKAAANYGVQHVNTNHPAATKVRVRLPSGQIRALKKMCGKPWYAGFGNQNVGTGIYSFNNWAERSLVNCWVPYPADSAPASCTFAFWPFWIIRNSSYDGALKWDQTTANKICQLQGFTRAVSFSRHSFSSPGDNEIAYWNGNAWVVRIASHPEVDNKYLLDLKCTCN